MITAREIEAARLALSLSLEKGASKARVNLTKTTMNQTEFLNSETDKISSCLDRSISICLFAFGRYGTFSTNRIEGIDEFIDSSIKMVRLMSPDSLRDLPDPSRCCRNAKTGDELQIWDPSFGTPFEEVESTLWKTSGGKEIKTDGGKRTSLVSVESEYSESETDEYIIDSQGLECRQRETSFEFYSEVTIEDPENGEKFSGSWWEATPMRKDLDWKKCEKEALLQAEMKIGPREIPGGKYTMILDRDCACDLVSPILSALSGYYLQQDNSFLKGSLAKKVFSEKLTLIDDPLRKGETGSRSYDSEGVAARQCPIIENGVVRRYLLSDYMGKKMGLEPTVEECIRARVMPCGGMKDRQQMMQALRRGIIVTDFNGGNSNTASGDFSFGIEGFYFEDGKIVHPVSGMLVTGNFVRLWNSLLCIGDDARTCDSKILPTMAFENIDFNA